MGRLQGLQIVLPTEPQEVIMNTTLDIISTVANDSVIEKIMLITEDHLSKQTIKTYNTIVNVYEDIANARMSVSDGVFEIGATLGKNAKNKISSFERNLKKEVRELITEAKDSNDTDTMQTLMTVLWTLLI